MNKLKIPQSIRILALVFLAIFLWGCGGIKKQNPAGVSSDLNSIKSIPTACKDPRGSFKPIIKILSKGLYNAEPKSYSPLIDPKGFIAEDFNNDNLMDYIFIERAKNDIQMILCTSDKNRLLRKITPFKVHEPLSQTFKQSLSLLNFQIKN